MIETSAIREHMEIIGADGVHIGTVDKIEGDRIKLTRQDLNVEVDGASSSHAGHHHYIPTGLVADIEGDQVRLSATGANAMNFATENDAGLGRGEGALADDGQVLDTQQNTGFGEETTH